MSGRPGAFYLPQLDGLRFVAFLLIFLDHAPSGQHLFDPGSAPALAHSLVHRTGWIGADLFLVLSAYLITTLLLLEHRRTGSIALRDFYVRRVLRIWPLYYLLCFLGFFVLPMLGRLAPELGSAAHSRLVSDYLLPYLTLFGNFAVGAEGYPSVQTLSHLWMIALQEQFYLLWPVLLGVLVTGRWRFGWSLVSVLLAGEFLLRLVVAPAVQHPWIWTFTLTRLDPFILGAALAFRHSRPRREASPQRACFLFCLAAALLAALALTGDFTKQPHLVSWQLTASAAGCALVLEALLSHRRGAATWLLSRPWITHLGKISYGLYAFHMLALQVGEWLARRVDAAVPKAGAATVWTLELLLSIGIVIAVSEVSFATFERPFLRLKSRFAHVASGANGYAAKGGRGTSRE